MDDDKRAELLKDEYILLQQQYDDIDDKGLTIKNWAITVALAIVGASLVYHLKDLLLLGVAAALVFWYLEAYWRGLSHFYVVRIRKIEEDFRSEDWKKETPLQIYKSWDDEYKVKKDQTLRYMFKQASLLPHIFIPFIFLIIYFILWK